MIAACECINYTNLYYDLFDNLNNFHLNEINEINFSNVFTYTTIVIITGTHICVCVYNLINFVHICKYFLIQVERFYGDTYTHIHTYVSPYHPFIFFLSFSL